MRWQVQILYIFRSQVKWLVEVQPEGERWEAVCRDVLVLQDNYQTALESIEGEWTLTRISGSTVGTRPQPPPTSRGSSGEALGGLQFRLLVVDVKGAHRLFPVASSDLCTNAFSFRARAMST